MKSPWRFWSALLAVLLSAGYSGCAQTPVPPLSAAERPANWAQPLPSPGLPNFFQVSAALYRGAQPTAEGMAELQRIGVKTDVNLRGWHDDGDKLKGSSLAYEPIPFHTWHPEDEDMVKFLQIVADPANQPVFVHCQRGIDRTGTMVAVYRLAVQGWSKQEALDELTRGGFGFDNMFPNLIKYVQNLDVNALKKEAGLGANGP